MIYSLYICLILDTTNTKILKYLNACIPYIKTSRMRYIQSTYYYLYTSTLIAYCRLMMPIAHILFSEYGILQGIPETILNQILENINTPKT